MNQQKNKTLDQNSSVSGEHSLFALHLAMMAREPMTPSLEEARISEFRKLPSRPLSLRQPLGRFRYTGPLLALAAGVLLYLVRPDQTDDFTIKGTSHVVFISEQAGVKKILDQNTRLASGDKANAEVLASEDSVGFMAVFDRKGTMLSDEKDLILNRLLLVKGEKKFFPTAVELVGSTEGETMQVVVCNKTLFERKYPDQSTFAKIMGRLHSDNAMQKEISNFCLIRNTKLRD